MTPDTERVRRVLGIDFSGNHLMWRAGTRRSNVWVATLELDGPRRVVNDLRRVQDLPGDGHPFARMAARLGDGDYAAACIDAPLGVPRSALPGVDVASLASELAAACPVGRPFATGAALVERTLPALAPRGAKRYRVCEVRWREVGLNVRAATWNGPRGGAPLAVAAMTLIATAGRPVWPWASADTGGVVAEGYPAAQLHAWGLPTTRYGRDDAVGAGLRAEIVDALEARGVEWGPARALAVSTADALDAVLAGLCAAALTLGTLVDTPSEGARDEGWIAVGR